MNDDTYRSYTGSAKELKEDIPKFSKISSAVAEGDINMKLHNWEKAENAYTRALELNPQNKSALVSRSKCYMNLGRFDEAIDDADRALSLDTKYYKGFLQKAEALYACGKFEFALVYYYKGFLLRKDIQDFRRGIRKAKIAINESIEQDALDAELACNNGALGNIVRQRVSLMETYGIRSRTTSNASEFVPSRNSSMTHIPSRAEATFALKSHEQSFPKPVDQKMAEMLKLPEKDMKSPLPPHMTEDYPGKMGEPQTIDSVDKTKLSRRRLLGEFTEDEKYLQNLLKDKTFQRDIDGSSKDNKIYDLVSSTLSYLDKRKQFWKHANALAQPEIPSRKPTSRPRTASARTIALSRPASAYWVRSKSAIPRATSDILNRKETAPNARKLKKSASSSTLRGRYSGATVHDSAFHNENEESTLHYSMAEEHEQQPSEIYPLDDRFLNDDPIIQNIYREQEELMESLRGLSRSAPLSRSNSRPDVKGMREKLLQRDPITSKPIEPPDSIQTPRNVFSTLKMTIPIDLIDDRSPQSTSLKVFDIIHKEVTPAEQQLHTLLLSEVEKVRQLILQENFSEAEKVAKETLRYLDSHLTSNPKEQQTKPRILYAELYSLLASIYHLTDRDPQAIVLYKRTVKFTLDNCYMDSHLIALTNLATLYESINMVEQAIETWETKGRVIFMMKNRTQQDNEELLEVYEIIGSSYEANFMYDKALEVLCTALNESLDMIAEENVGSTPLDRIVTRRLDKIGVHQLGIAFKIANIYFKRSEFERAIEYFEKYLDLGRKYNQIQVQSQALTNLGNTYLTMSKLHGQHLAREDAQVIRSRKILSKGVHNRKEDYLSKALYYQKMAMRMRAAMK